MWWVLSCHIVYPRAFWSGYYLEILKVYVGNWWSLIAYTSPYTIEETKRCSLYRRLSLVILHLRLSPAQTYLVLVSYTQSSR